VPVAEKTFQSLREAAGKNADVNFIAVSHSDQEATDKWIIAVGGEWDTHVIVDAERELYSQWGLGVSSAWHVLNPWSMYSVWKLGKQENIWNKPTESGSRWQTVRIFQAPLLNHLVPPKKSLLTSRQQSGSFAVDSQGIVRWAKVAKAADEIPDFNEALKTLGIGV